MQEPVIRSLMDAGVAPDVTGAMDAEKRFGSAIGAERDQASTEFWDGNSFRSRTTSGALASVFSGAMCGRVSRPSSPWPKTTSSS
jgi:hypothetical protein